MGRTDLPTNCHKDLALKHWKVFPLPPPPPPPPPLKNGKSCTYKKAIDYDQPLSTSARSLYFKDHVGSSYFDKLSKCIQLS